MTTKKQTTTILALLSVTLSMTLTPAFASSTFDVDPWTDYKAVPNSTTGDERAIANSGDSYVYAKIPSNVSWGDAEANVYQNFNTGIGSTPSLFVGAGANSVYFDVEFAYDGHITADAWGGISELSKRMVIYKDGSQYAISTQELGGAGDKTSTSDTDTASVGHSGSHTYKAYGWFKANTNTYSFQGEQEVDFYNDPHYVLVEKITIRT